MRYLLAVDDEKEILDIYEATFTPPDYEVMIAPNGKEATRLIRRNQYQVILTDFKMPWVDGADLYTRIRDTRGYETTPIIFITGFGDDLSPDIRADKNVVVLEKPVDLESLVKLVDAVFAKLEKEESEKPKPKIDIETVDQFLKSTLHVLTTVTGQEDISSMRPYVFKMGDAVCDDVVESLRFETDTMTGTMFLLFRSDAYMWLSSVASASNFKSVEHAVEEQGGRVIKMVQKSMWKRLELATNESATNGYEIETKKGFEGATPPPIVIPLRAGFGEVHAAISIKLL